MKKEKKPAVSTIINSFLRDRINMSRTRIVHLATHHFQDEVFQYGLARFGVKYTPETYARIWRRMRSGEKLEKYGLTANEITSPFLSTEKWWEIKIKQD